MMNRRTFVGNLTLVSAAASLGLGSVFVRQKRLGMAEIDTATLAPLVNGPVSLRDAEGGTRLATVQDVQSIRHPAGIGAPATEQVSLLLQLEDPAAPAGIYRVETADLCLGDLHFSRVNGVGRDQRFEAVITRIV